MGEKGEKGGVRGATGPSSCVLSFFHVQAWVERFLKSVLSRTIVDQYTKHLLRSKLFPLPAVILPPPFWVTFRVLQPKSLPAVVTAWLLVPLANCIPETSSSKIHKSNT